MTKVIVFTKPFQINSRFYIVTNHELQSNTIAV
jgi:hypothetical protein